MIDGMLLPTPPMEDHVGTIYVMIESSPSFIHIQQNREAHD